MEVVCVERVGPDPCVNCEITRSNIVIGSIGCGYTVTGPIEINRRSAELSLGGFMLGISSRTLWSLTIERAIPHVRIRSRVLYLPEDLRDWLQRQQQGGDR